MSRLRIACFIVFGAQLMAMWGFSTYQYVRDSLTLDFAAYSQAVSQISSGNLSPYSTVLRASFWRNNAEFAIWPLALLYHFVSSSVLLLVIQDLCVVAAGAVAFLWILEFLVRQSPRLPHRARVILASGALAALVLNPWAYETIAFDFHLEALVALFLVLSGRALWSGRVRQLWWWIPLTLVSSALGGLYLAGLGVSAVVAGRRTRRAGVAMGAIGLGWAALFSAVGAVGLDGRALSQNYGYLVGGGHGAHVDMISIVSGAVTHPGALWHLLGPRWVTLFEFLVVVGLIGIFSPWAFGVFLAVFLPALLAANGLFFQVSASFQLWPAMPFLVVGSVMVLARLHSLGPFWRRLEACVATVWASFLVVLAAIGITALPGNWVGVNSAAAAGLSRAQQTIPATSEVIAWGGIVGRFADRKYIFNVPFNNHSPKTSAMTFPVAASRVVFVITPRQGISEIPTREALDDITYVEDTLKGRVLAADAGVYVLEWMPPKDQRQVTLP